MRTLGNILWHVPFLGFITSFFTFLIGGLFVITVVGAPIGFGLIQLAKFFLAPFSNAMVKKSDLNAEEPVAWKSYETLIRILYFPFGLILAILSVFQIAAEFISIIGIPVALAQAKALSTIFNPVGKKSVSKAVADEITSRKAKSEADKAFSA